MLDHLPRSWVEPAAVGLTVEALAPLPGLDVDADDVLRDYEDLAFLLSESADGGVEGALVYRSDLFDRARIDRLADDFVTVLQAFVEHPFIRLTHLERSASSG
jgi:hypothetical protein